MGALARITQVQVYIIAAVLTAIAVAGLWFGLVGPEQEEANSQMSRDQGLEPEAGEDKKIAAQKSLKDAKIKVAEAEAKWDVYDRRLMPTINLSEGVIPAAEEHWKEQILVLGPKLDHFIHSDPNVQVLSGNVQLPAPSPDPNDVKQPIFVYKLNNITVEGTFANILKNVERWNHLDRLAEVDGLQLAGSSPQLEGTYSVTVYEFPQGQSKDSETVPGSVGGRGGFGGGFGGPPAGFGGPPGGFGGPPPGMGGPPPGMGGPPGGFGGPRGAG